MKVSYETPPFEVPNEGMCQATLTTVKDLGIISTNHGDKPMVRFVWALDSVDSYGNPLRAFQRFARTLHPKSFLTQAIRDITGKEPGRQFELDDLIGRRVQLVLKHNTSADGRVYCNVASILRPATPKGQAEEEPVARTTAKVKQKASATTPSARPTPPATSPAPLEISDADIPF